MSRMVKKLVAAWSRATSDDKRNGAEWYSNAREECRAMAAEYGVSHECAAGVVAVLSPRLRWSVNLKVARSVLATGTSRGVFRASLVKAQAIAAGAAPLSVLSGPKVRAFYKAIMGDDSAAVVDVWVLRVVGWTKSVTANAYAKIADALAKAASIVGASVCEVQATTWVAIRGSAA